jgi:hypothetical protein
MGAEGADAVLAMLMLMVISFKILCGVQRPVVVVVLAVLVEVLMSSSENNIFDSIMIINPYFLTNPSGLKTYKFTMYLTQYLVLSSVVCHSRPSIYLHLRRVRVISFVA